MLKIIRTLIILLVALVITGFIWYNYQISAPASSNDAMVSFEIGQGQGVNQISQELYNKGLISSQFYFEVYVWAKNLESNIIQGQYQLSASMNIKEITSIITKLKISLEECGNVEINTNIEKCVKTLEGWDNHEIGAYLESLDLFSQQEFLDEVGKNLSKYYDEYEFLSDKPQNVDLEGYLFPDTYRIFKNSTPHDIAGKMLDNFDNKITEDLRQKIENQGKTIFEVITLASIIEKEVMNPNEMKMIADIFYKRLENNIALQSDATVNYITGKGTVQPTIEDTQVDHPYNTYKHPGLTPGPISNPGLNAIIAAIEPTSNPYYYFLTTPEGEVIYSTTYKRHLESKAIYLD